MANQGMGILSGATSGAAAGSVAGPLGTAGGAILGAGMGLLSSSSNEAKENTELQEASNRRLMQEGYALQRQMYDYTYSKNTPAAQVRNLELAGLNPALLYGQTGAGATQGQTGSGGTSVGMAATSTSAQRQGMALQLASLASEIKVNESIANKNNTEAEKTAGVDTEAAKQSIQNMIASAATEGERKILTRVESRLKDVETDILESNSSNIIRNSEIAIEEAGARIRSLTESTDITAGTKQSVIQEAKARAVGAVLQNMATETGIQLTKAQINSISENIAQGWKGLDIQEDQTNIKRYETDIKRYEAELKGVMPGVGQVSGRVLNAGTSAIMNILKGIDKFMGTEMPGTSNLGEMPEMK